MKVLVGMFQHETNTFSVLRTRKEDFERLGLLRGQESLDLFRGTSDYFGGMIEVAERHGVSLIPSYHVSGAGPLITRECLDEMVGDLVACCQKHLGEYKGICLALHGAGCAEGVEDIEAYTLKAIREVVGGAMPITVTLDLHGNISDAMANEANGLFGCKEYPHIDCAEAGVRAMNCLIEQLASEVSVETVHIKLPLLLAPSRACTFHDPLLSIRKYVDSIRGTYELYDASFFHGFPYSDISLLGCSVVTVAANGKAREAAEVIADWVWARREELVADCPTAAEAVAAAIACGEFPAVINEASDNPGGGAPADGTHLLRELIKADFPRTIFGYLCDPETVEQAHREGVGARIKTRIGGKTDKIHGETLELEEVLVCALSDGNSIRVTPMGAGLPYNFGRMARLRYSNVDIIVGSLPLQTLDDRPFLVTGADFRQYSIVALKSTNHFRAFFEPNAKRIFTADPPGIHTANFSLLPYQKLPRPIFPLDKVAEWR